jgi:hypothetical protein
MEEDTCMSYEEEDTCLRVGVVNNHQWYSPQTDALDEPK